MAPSTNKCCIFTHPGVDSSHKWTLLLSGHTVMVPSTNKCCIFTHPGVDTPYKWTLLLRGHPVMVPSTNKCCILTHPGVDTSPKWTPSHGSFHIKCCIFTHPGVDSSPKWTPICVVALSATKERYIFNHPLSDIWICSQELSTLKLRLERSLIPEAPASLYRVCLRVFILLFSTSSENLLKLRQFIPDDHLPNSHDLHVLKCTDMMGRNLMLITFGA